jgi:ubiquinone/menaquinone biosynthesis C-methylase UbiE
VAGVALSFVEGWAALIAFVGAGCLLATAGAMVVSSKVLKLRQRDRMLDLIAWRGDEEVLDVGCGRGLLVIGAAKRLSTGKAVGIDIWQEQDQSGNRPEATRANAEAEGVSDRVEVLDADARKLPFGDESFDVVLSSLVIHNLHVAADRASAVREIVRVLKPGGRVAICDILHTRSYARMLEEKGLENVHRPRPHLMFFGPVWTVTGTKHQGL